MDRLTQERIAENDSRFREANEGIHEFAARHAVDIAIPFLCECADPTCVKIVRLELEEYRHVRTDPRWFLKVAGHEQIEGAAARVVSSHDGWVLVEKVGHAARVAEERARDLRGEPAEER